MATPQGSSRRTELVFRFGGTGPGARMPGDPVQSYRA